MGLALSLTDFRAIFVAPRAVLLGLACQILLLPLIGLELATLQPLDGRSRSGQSS